MSRPAKKPVDAGPGWLATYGDLVTLLLAFFVMLFAVSSVEAEKFEAFLSGLGHFDNSATNPGVFPPNSTDTPIVTINTGIGQKTIEEVRQQAESEAEREAIEQEITDAVETAGLGGSLELRADPRGIAAVLTTDNVLFESGSAALTGPGSDVIERIAGVLQKLAYDITVEGHTDDTPLNRAGYTNWNLSTDRAVSVVQSFANLHAIAPTRLSAVGYGEFKPIDRSGTSDARSRNRRVEIIIHTVSNQRLAETSKSTQQNLADAASASVAPAPVIVAPILGSWIPPTQPQPELEPRIPDAN